MAYLMLYGNGWTQRWIIAPAMEAHVRDEIARVGTDATGSITVVDPGSESAATLMIAWAHIATAVVLDHVSAAGGDETTGQYA